MEYSVKERIAQLRIEARDADIYGKASTLARLKGVRSPKKHGAWHHYQGENLQISWDDFAPTLSVKWKGREVFLVHFGKVKMYRPDVEGWIKELEFQHSVLKPERDEVEKAKLAVNWGIMQEEV